MKIQTIPRGITVALLVAALWALSPSAFADTAPQLTVQVATDKPEYQDGELVTITVRVTFQGQPIAAKLDKAVVEVQTGLGTSRRSSLAWEFRQVQPGLFIAQARAQGGGFRHFYVLVRAYAPGGCGCNVLFGSGSVDYVVQPLCPCLKLVRPDFLVTYSMSTVPGADPPVSFALPLYVTAALSRLSPTLTYAEAPAGSVVWSVLPPFGVANDGLASLKLSLHPQTGTISGDLDFNDVKKPRYHFYIKALNGEGQFIAGIWVQLVFFGVPADNP